MKYLMIFSTLIPFSLKAQFDKPDNPSSYQYYSSFNADETAKHIMMFHIKSHLQDTVEFLIEKNNSKYSKKILNVSQTEKKLIKILKKGKSSFSSKFNSGYIFSIVISDPKDDTKILYFIKFEVDHDTQKIKSIEISKGI